VSRKAEEGDFKMSNGSTYALHSILFSVTSDDDCSDDQPKESEESEEDLGDDMEDVIDSAMASATARFASGVNPEHLRESPMKMLREHLTTPRIFYRGLQTPSCPETMEPTTGC
jgi:hypothetical protein